MGKVLIQVGASEEARAAAETAAATGAPAPALVLPRSNVPEEIQPVEEKEEAAEASSSEGAAADAKAAPEVGLPLAYILAILLCVQDLNAIKTGSWRGSLVPAGRHACLARRVPEPAQGTLRSKGHLC